MRSTVQIFPLSVRISWYYMSQLLNGLVARATYKNTGYFGQGILKGEASLYC
jgi:hypothetical protein